MRDRYQYVLTVLEKSMTIVGGINVAVFVFNQLLYDRLIKSGPLQWQCFPVVITVNQIEHRQLQGVGRQCFEACIVVKHSLHAFCQLRTRSEAPVYEVGDGFIFHGLDSVGGENPFIQRLVIIPGPSGGYDKLVTAVATRQLLNPVDNPAPLVFWHFIQRVQADQATPGAQGVFKKAFRHADLQRTLGIFRGALGDQNFFTAGVIAQVQVKGQERRVGLRRGADRRQVT